MPVVIFPKAIDFDGHPDSQQLNQAYLDESNVSTILGLTGAFASAALITTILLLYVRNYMLHFIGPDDWTMAMATLLALGTFACFVGESYCGMGRHWQWQQPLMTTLYFKWLSAHSLLVMLGAIFVKISIALFLMRILLQKSWRIFLWCSISQYYRDHVICIHD